MSKLNNGEASGVPAGTMDVMGETSIDPGSPTAVADALASRKAVRRRVAAMDRLAALKKAGKQKTH